MAKQVLIENGAADTTGETTLIIKEQALFAAIGTFGGATVTFEYSIDGSTGWVSAKYEDGTVVEVTENENQIKATFQPSEYSVRGVITGGDINTDLTLTMTG